MQAAIREGMPVIDATGRHIGRVEHLTGRHFFITRTSLVHERIVADADAVEDVVNGEVRLNVDREALLELHLRPPGDHSLVEVEPSSSTPKH
jgi:hypothetical protein